MSSRTLLAQDDFSSLELAAGPIAEKQSLDDFHGFATFERAGTGNSMKSESTCEADQSICPVHFVSDEVYELIRNWELTYSKQQEINYVGSMNDVVQYDPMRCMSDFAPPPKRFYRTFWRSVTRRIIQHEMKSARRASNLSRFDTSDDKS